MDETKYEIHFDGPIEGVSLGENNNSSFDYKQSKEKQNQNTPSSFWNIPYRRNPFFTGRERLLEQLHESLSSTKTTSLTQPQAISGLGGIGKTQTALEYAYRYHEEYTSILWVRATTREAFILDIIAIADLLRLQENDERDSQKVVASVKFWLETHDGWLLILDNADNLEILYDFLPTADKGKILLTTRNQIGGPIADIVPIGTMDIQEGILLLLRRAKILARKDSITQVSKEDLDIALHLIEALDSLPLAIDQAGAYIEETKCELSVYLQLYQQQDESFLKRRGMSIYHPEPVATTWSISFERIQQDSPIAADVLRLCAFLDSDSIPEEIFTTYSSILGPALRRITHEPSLLNEAISTLLTYSLVHRNPDHTLTIHKLVQSVLKHGMDKKTYRLWARRTIHAIEKIFPGVKYDTWQLCQKYFSHVQACLLYIIEQKFTFSETTDLLIRAGEYLVERFQFEQAETFYQCALSIQEKVLGPECPQVIKILHHLAHLYQDQGKYEQAESFHLRELAIGERVFGLEHPDIIESLHCIASLYRVQGKYEQAESVHLRELAIREHTLGSEHPDITKSLYSLAYVYQDQGKYEQAESSQLRALAIGERVFGLDHSEIAPTLHHLAHIYEDQGKYEQAESVHLRELAIREHTLGSEHPQTAESLHCIARLYRAQGKYEQAESFHLRALAIRERVFGLEHPQVARVLHNLAHVYEDQGKYEQAESFHLRELAICEHTLGSEHPQTSDSLHCIAHLYRAQGKYEQAESFHLRALAIRERVFGLEHPQVARVLHSLAHLYEDQGKYEQAESFYLRDLAICQRTLGSEHSRTAESLHCIARLYRAQGKYKQARTLYKQVLNDQDSSLDPNIPTP